MAESRGSLLAKSVQKHAGRAKEKILQNLGKVDRTADEIFDEHLQNFTRQQNGANRLQKEFNNYIRCIRAAQTASKSLLEAIGEIYESQWTGHDMMYVQTQSVDMLWQDFCHKLADQVLLPLNTYQQQFPEMRKKIDKRGRKLVDYDSQRHSFQALQTNMKKRDDAKIAKGREQLEEAKRTYEMLNSELHDELPALHDSRILFLVTNLQSLFNAEHTFHTETSKVFNELEEVVDKLATDSQRGSYSVKKTNGASPPYNNKTTYKNSPLIINNISPSTPKTPEDSPTKKESPKHELIITKTSSPSSPTSENSDQSPSSPPTSPSKPDPIKDNNRRSVSSVPPHEVKNQDSTAVKNELNGTAPPPTSKFESKSNTPEPKSPIVPPSPTSALPVTPVTPPPATLSSPDPALPSSPLPPTTPQTASEGKPPDTNSANLTEAGNKNVEELYDIPEGASTDNLPSGVLYRVKATYKYNREDVDELSFDVGEIIQVIEYDDPEEQEEGWLMGQKEGSTEKGMFPANFTRPL